jgi:hypothetical protein
MNGEPAIAGTWPGGGCPALPVVAAFALAFGYFEAAVEIYLREFYYPAGFAFPLAPMDHRLLIIEVAREVFGMAVLVSFARFTGRRLAERFAFFCLSFALWDLSYYLWLKVLRDWPVSPFTPDQLYLIPVPWIGPVLSPLLVSTALLFGSCAILYRLYQGGGFRPSWREWVIALGGALLIILSYTTDLETAAGRDVPEPYRWEFLIVGLACGLFALARSLQRTHVPNGSDIK